MKKLFVLLLIYVSALLGSDKIEKWDYFELTLKGPDTGNPFTEVEITAVFKNGNKQIEVNGFYSGGGEYKVRFMPTTLGVWRYKTQSNKKQLSGKKGQFECMIQTEDNHGLVQVDKKTHFNYSDGTSYYPFGTTCYAWTNQPDSVQEYTLETLKKSPFNKLRMCVLPKNQHGHDMPEPKMYPFVGSPSEGWDFSHFNAEYFQNLENRILQLRDLNIECDLILFHPYDDGRWGFDQMTMSQSEFYIEYLIARFSAFRHIWWSAANEYDLCKNKNDEDWDRILKIIQEEDKYQHLRSIHNWNNIYDATKPLVTHASIQKIPFRMRDLIKQFNKPVIIDECGYEGNIQFTWGDLTPQTMTQKFWMAVINGGYASHGETYVNVANTRWWAQGGLLEGKSIARIQFLKEIIYDLPENGLVEMNASPTKWNRLNSVKLNDDYFLFYFEDRQHCERFIELPENKKYKIEIIDTWDMTIEELEGVFSGETRVPLPTKPYMALRVRSVDTFKNE